MNYKVDIFVIAGTMMSAGRIVKTDLIATTTMVTSHQIEATKPESIKVSKKACQILMEIHTVVAGTPHLHHLHLKER